MKLVVFALLGCCVVADSASLSDSSALSKKSEELLSLESSEAGNGFELDETESTKRDKRSGLGGSGGFLSGIGSAILGKVAEASSGISSGSSSGSSSDHGRGHQYESVEYGAPVHGYDDQNFDIWSFKRAILNTLFQALKAIGGGVIALKGKLIKGGGVVISTKGRIISAKGEAITTLGRNIAASAILSPPRTSHEYAYEAPAVHVPSGHGHDSYSGPPPSAYGHHGGYVVGAASSDSHGHSAYAAPSDDAEHPGLVIVKSSHQGTTQQNPLIAALSQKKAGIQNLLGRVLSGALNAKNIGGAGAGAHGSVVHSLEQVEHKEHVPIASGSYDHGPLIHSNEESHVIHSEGSSDNGDSYPVHNEQRYQYQIETHHGNNEHGGLGAGGISVQQLPHANYVPFATNSNFMFSGPSELPVVQPHLHNQPNYYSGQHEQLNNFNGGHNEYNTVLRRDGRSETPSADVRVIPAIGYTLKNSRVYRI